MIIEYTLKYERIERNGIAINVRHQCSWYNLNTNGSKGLN